jgi:hypothetical protein
MAIVKALQEIETIQINKNILKTILIHTDNRITLDSLKNMKNRNYLIEAIREKKHCTGERKLAHTQNTPGLRHTRAMNETNSLTNLLRKPPERAKYATPNSPELK